MANLVPGFVWHPIDVGNRARRAKGRGLIAHVAVSESAMLVPSGTAATRSADWHFYLPKSGPGYQFIDLDLQCWATAAGNTTLPAFESQGGVNGAQTEPWTGNQIELAAQILAHLHKTEGTPLQLMPNSLPGSKGLAPHRWGISPWRVLGGEVWSSSNGKVCPGDAKVAQLPLIVLRAAAIVHGSPTPTVQEDEMALIQHADRGIAMVGPGYFRPLPPNEVGPAVAVFGSPHIFGTAAEFDLAKSACIGGSAEGQLTGTLPGTLNADLRGDLKNKGKQLDALAAAVAALSGSVPPTDVQAVVSGVLGGLDGASLKVTPPAAT
jgi:hypothetical protein